MSLIILLPIANTFHKFHGPPTLNFPRNVKPVTSQKSHAISEISRATNLQFLQERQALPLAKSHTRPNVNFNQKTKFYQVRQAPAWSSKHWEPLERRISPFPERVVPNDRYTLYALYARLKWYVLLALAPNLGNNRNFPGPQTVNFTRDAKPATGQKPPIAQFKFQFMTPILKIWPR